MDDTQNVFTTFADIFGRDDESSVWCVELKDGALFNGVETLYVSAKTEHAARELVASALIGLTTRMGIRQLLDAARNAIQSQGK